MSTLSSLLSNIVLEVLATATIKKKEIKGMTNEKEAATLSLFEDDLILCIGQPKDSTNISL